jgi:tetratricopeptide (TPR) repeat protein
MPSRTLCLNYLESFPSFYLYRERLQKADRDELKSAFNDAAAHAEETVTLDHYISAMRALIEFVGCDLVAVRMNKAFETIFSDRSLAIFDGLKALVEDAAERATNSSAETNPDAGTEAENESTVTNTGLDTEDPELLRQARRLLSQHFDIRGQHFNFHCNYTSALTMYNNAIDASPDDIEITFETKLRIGQILIDIGKDVEAVELYDKCVTALNKLPMSGKQLTNLAWTYVHRFNVCTVKNQFGLYSLDTLNECMNDLQKGLQNLSE